MGRRSGESRITPLLYVEDEGIFAVVASNMGDARFPGWWYNLQTKPDADMQVGRRKLRIRARRAEPGEEARLWPKLEAVYASYSDYRARAGRVIPIVLLEPWT